MMMPLLKCLPVMKEARADFDRMLRDQQKLHTLASVRKDLEKAHADVMNAVPQTAMPPAAVIKERGRRTCPTGRHMDVDPSLSERRRASSPSTTSANRWRTWDGPVGAEEAKAGGPREWRDRRRLVHARRRRGLVDVRAAQARGGVFTRPQTAARARRHEVT